jgi:hypothetical protein
MANCQQNDTSTMNDPNDFYEQEVPERLQDDPLVSYFRCRYKEREALLSHFEERFKEKKYKFERVKQELTRIEELRSEFHTTHKYHMDRLRDAREAWMKEAKEKCAERIQTVQESVESLRGKTDHKSLSQLSRKLDELRILSRVPTLTVEDPPLTNSTKSRSSTSSRDSGNSAISPSKAIDTTSTIRSTEISQPDPDHGFMVSMITLRKKAPKSSYVNFEMDKLPVNKALDGTPDNPLKQRCEHCEPDTLRYFHFPANNMDWVEVCPAAQ